MSENASTPLYSRSMRLGIILLIILIVILSIFWRLIPVLYNNEKEDDKLLQSWDHFKNENLAEKQNGKNKTDDWNDYSPTEIKLFTFDPNTATEQELITLGIPVRTAQTIIKYRSKGGVYRKPEDLQKIYTLSKEDYERIAPYIKIAGNNNQSASGYYSNNTNYTPGKYAEPSSINLNTTNAEELMKLRGIGPAYANRIIATRDKLGGFLNVQQAEQMMGLPDSTFQLIKSKLIINPADVRKLNINTATLEQLAAHPFIGKKLAENILMLRKDLKTFSKIEQLRQVPLINEEKYRKIVPYITLN